MDNDPTVVPIVTFSLTEVEDNKILVGAEFISYQAMVSSNWEAEIISMSPSPSISAAKTDVAASADVAILAAVKVGFAFPSFSYQAMVSSK